MGLQYMVCDTDLAKAKVKGPKQAALRLRKQPKKPLRKICLILVVLVNILLWALVAYSLTDGGAYIWRRLTDRRMVTGIMHTEGTPRAIVRGRVVHEGDIINGHKVVEIREHEVVFEKNGQRFIEQAY